MTIVVAIGNHQSRDAKTRGIPRLRKETGDTPVLSFSLGFPGTIGNTRLLLGGHTAYAARETTHPVQPRKLGFQDYAARETRLLVWL